MYPIGAGNLRDLSLYLPQVALDQCSHPAKDQFIPRYLQFTGSFIQHESSLYHLGILQKLPTIRDALRWTNYTLARWLGQGTLSWLTFVPERDLPL